MKATQNTTHAYLPSSLVFCALIDLWLTFESQKTFQNLSSIAVLVTQFLSLALIFITPHVGGSITIILNNLITVFMPHMLLITLANTCISIVILSYKTYRLLEITTLSSITYISIAYNINENPTLLAANIAAILCTATSISIPLLIRWRNASIYEANKRINAKTQKRNAEIALQLHDSLTNDLSYITAASMAHSDNDDDWNRISKRAQQSSQTLHHIIRDISSGNNNNENVVGSHLHSLCAIASQQQKDLQSVGYIGSIRISTISDAITISTAIYKEMKSLLLELVSNIRRHASKKAQYRIAISFLKDAVEISQTNAIDLTPREKEHESGFGLEQHFITITNLGGEMHYSTDENTWILYAKIPLK